MSETGDSIAKWAEETFGETITALRVVARANEELAELLRAITAGRRAEEFVVECADVAIVLCRLAKMFDTDFITDHRNWETSYSPRDFTQDMHYVSEILHNTASLVTAITYGYRDSYIVNTILCMRINLERLCTHFEHNLYEQIDKKMAINRQRKWKSNGTGHGYHVRD